MEILSLVSEKGLLAPGDAASLLGAPRYRVLAAFHCLEELGLIEAVYKRGSYKVYRISRLGEEVLARLEGSDLASILELGVSASYTHQENSATS